MPNDPTRPPVDVQGALEIGYRLERAMFDLYQVLATAHEDAPTIAKLWRKTAREEEQHAAQFRLALSNARSMVFEVRAEWKDALQMVQAIEALVQRYRANPPTIPEALRSAIALEKSLAHLHVDRACVFANDAHQRLFRAMMAADEEHIGSLENALRDYNGDANDPDTGRAG